MSVASDKPEVVLLGTVHRVQSIDERIAVWAQRSKDFKRGVEKLVEDFGIKFIGEEAAQDRLSSAGNVALDHFVRYVNLDIPLCAQNQIRLHPETNETTSFDENKRDPYVLAWDRVREYHMYQRFVESRADLTPSLFICGQAHQQRLMELLQKAFTIHPKTAIPDSDGKLRFSDDK